jgi:hypothetical protein
MILISQVFNHLTIASLFWSTVLVQCLPHVFRCFIKSNFISKESKSCANAGSKFLKTFNLPREAKEIIKQPRGP